LSRTVYEARKDPQANTIFALECLMHETWATMPEGADGTDVRLVYITTLLRHFDVTPKATCGYHPDHPPFDTYAGGPEQ